jgi:hypothetical protein
MAIHTSYSSGMPAIVEHALRSRRFALSTHQPISYQQHQSPQLTASMWAMIPMFLVFETSLTTSLAVLALFGNVLVKARLVTDKFQDGVDRYDQVKTLTGRIYGRCNELEDCNNVLMEKRAKRCATAAPSRFWGPLGPLCRLQLSGVPIDVFRFSN